MPEVREEAVVMLEDGVDVAVGGEEAAAGELLCRLFDYFYLRV
jgi:hypothetical protein